MTDTNILIVFLALLTNIWLTGVIFWVGNQLIRSQGVKYRKVLGEIYHLKLRFPPRTDVPS